MTDPTIIVEYYQRGLQYYSDLNKELLSAYKVGTNIYPSKEKESLYRALLALKMKIGLNEFDEVTESNYEEMMRIIGEYQYIQPPIVNAGEDQTIVLPDNETVFTGTAISERGIASVLWTQISGGNEATLSGQTSLFLTVSNMILGEYVFRLTATDNFGLSNYNDVRIHVKANDQTLFLAEWGFSDTDIYSQIISGNRPSLQFNESYMKGITSYDLNYTSSAQGKYLIKRVPSTEIAMNTYFNTSQNQGSIPSVLVYRQFVYGGERYEMTKIPFDFQVNNYSITYSSI